MAKLERGSTSQSAAPRRGLVAILKRNCRRILSKFRIEPSLEERNVALTLQLEQKEHQCVVLQAKLAKQTDHRCVVLQSKLDNRERLVAALKKQVGDVKERFRTNRDKWMKVGQHFRDNPTVCRTLRFARHCYDAAEDLQSDVVIAHGELALPAAEMIAERTGARIYCDVIEIPSFVDRILDVAWHPTNLSLLNRAIESYLQRCDGLLTVGWALKEQIVHYGPPVTVIPNYRYAEKLKPSNAIRERCGLAAEDRLVLSISTTASGFEDVLRALARLPETVHLATLGRFVPRAYQEKIFDLAVELGLKERLHVFDSVPYEELTSMASGADVGLIVRDPAILNNRISLPNRIFDYMHSSLPVCAPQIPDIARILTDHDMGAVVDPMTPEGWAGAIATVLERSEEMRANALRASGELTWELLEDDLYEALGKPRSVTFVGMKDLRSNNRTHRMARSLAQRGAEVRIWTRGEAGDTPASDDLVSYFVAPFD